ncbi:hypothetical protein RhiirC2_794882 [Rhizophagus irregularis]|uniref:Uncharacterized protein n=1 Tax=Rhizophagus irregularis TaxID=588596 RepID=A0A2N1MCN4_9GLOM|nr:hypothetical protein RhiirC2_794882 [Rhizophagus irregularis]
MPGLALSAIGFMSATTTDVCAILKKNEAYKLFEENIHPCFMISEYGKQNIDRNKIEVIENVMNQILEEEIELDVDLNNNEKTKYSTNQEIVKAVVEGICKLAPSPLLFYSL